MRLGDLDLLEDEPEVGAVQGEALPVGGGGRRGEGGREHAGEEQAGDDPGDRPAASSGAACVSC